MLLVKEDLGDAILYSPRCGGATLTSFLLKQDGDYVLRQDGDHLIIYGGPGSDGNCMPYDIGIWGLLCLTGPDGGGPLIPQPPCTDAECVEFPACHHHKILVREELATPWEAIEVGDLNLLAHAAYGSMRRLERFGATYPNLWARIDSEADPDDPIDWTTFNVRVPWGRLFSLPVPARRKLELAVFWSCEMNPVVMPAIDRRG